MSSRETALSVSAGAPAGAVPVSPAVAIPVAGLSLEDPPAVPDPTPSARAAAIGKAVSSRTSQTTRQIDRPNEKERGRPGPAGATSGPR
jgi:hypothetical protein